MRLPCSDFNVFRQLSSSLAGRVVVMPFLKRLGPLLAFQRGMLVAALAYVLAALSCLPSGASRLRMLLQYGKARDCCWHIRPGLHSSKECQQ